MMMGVLNSAIHNSSYKRT